LTNKLEYDSIILDSITSTCITAEVKYIKIERIGVIMNTLKIKRETNYLKSQGYTERRIVNALKKIEKKIKNKEYNFADLNK